MHLASLDRQRDVIERGEGAEALRYAAQGQDSRRGFRLVVRCAIDFVCAERRPYSRTHRLKNRIRGTWPGRSNATRRTSTRQSHDLAADDVLLHLINLGGDFRR